MNKLNITNVFYLEYMDICLKFEKSRMLVPVDVLFL